MRARNIKPGFFLNEDLVSLSAMHRLFFIGLWCYADRDGRFEVRPMRIKMAVLPADNIDVVETLADLEKIGMIEQYEVDGCKYCQIINFDKHQSPHARESKSVIPPKASPRHLLGNGEASPRSPECGMRNEERGILKEESTRDARRVSVSDESLAAISTNSPHHANAHLHYASAGPGARLYSTRNERVPETVAVIELWQAADRTQKLRAGEIKRAECFVLPREAVDNAAEVIAALQASDFARKWPFAVAFRPKNLQDLLNGAYSQAEDESEAEAEERYAQLARQI